MVMISVVLAAGLLSSVIVAPTAAASDGGGDGRMEITDHFAQTEMTTNETAASNETTTSNETTASNETTTSASQASRPANASLSIDENGTTPSRVSLASVSLPTNGFIVVHNDSYSPTSPESDSIIGRTQYVRGGNFTDVYVPLYNISGREFDRSQITGTQQVHVLLYNDSNGSQAFDSADDQPYQNSSEYPISGSTTIDGIDTGRLDSGTDSPTPQPSQSPQSSQSSQSAPSSESPTTVAPDQTSPEQPSQRATGGHQSAETSSDESGFLQTAASVMLVVLGSILVYRGLHS